jgi:tetratricopeptide (TPR) repeat protein
MHANAAAAFCSINRFREAELAARAALRQSAGHPLAHQVLGLSLASTGQYTEEALESLRHAAKSFPRARLATARLLVAMEREEEAMAVLRRHLRDGGEEDRQAAAEWLGRLEASVQSGQTEEADSE